MTSKVCVVTGAGRGIGKACAIRLARAGYDVALVDVRDDLLTATAKEVDATGVRAVPLVADVAVPGDVARAAETVLDEFGRVDVLVNNAGVGGGVATEQCSEAEWDRIVDVCLKGTFLCSREFSRALFETGGAVVNMSSILALAPMPSRAAYSAAKAGVIALTKVLAAEWGPRGVRVNAVAPGYVDTEGVQAGVDTGIIDLEQVRNRVPAGRLANVDDVAAAVEYLASPEAAYVTGHVLVTDGGYTSFGAWWPAGTPAPGTSNPIEV